MNETVKESLIRSRPERGLYLSVFFGLLGFLFFFGDFEVQLVIDFFPSIIYELEKVTILFMGENIPIHTILRAGTYFCIFCAFVSWFDGLLIELLKLIAALIITLVIFSPIGKILIHVDFGNYIFSIDILLHVFLYLFIVTTIITMLLEVYRYRYDVSLDKEYENKEIREFEELILPEKSTINPILNKIFRSPDEFSWFDNDFQKPVFNPENKYINTDWIQQKTKYITSNKEKMKRIGTMYFFVTIYAIIIFITVDEMKFPMDATIRTFSFPIMIYFILGFRNLGKLIKSALVMLFYSYGLIFMFQVGIITSDGIFYIYYYNLLFYSIYLVFLFLINPVEIFNGIINGFNSPFSPLNNESVIQLTEEIFSTFYTIAGISCLFFYLIIWFFSTRKKQSSVIISDKDIFIRDKERTSKINEIKIALLLLINPISPKNYHNVFTRIQYNRMASLDGGNFDYGKIPYTALKKVKKTKAYPIYDKLVIIIFIALFLNSTFNAFIGNPDLLNILGNITFLAISIVMYRLEQKKKDLFDILLVFDRSLIKGSWIYGHTYTSIQFKEVTDEFANSFLQFCNPEVISQNRIIRNRKKIPMRDIPSPDET
jgi:hypothetical protein